jgi:uncharacterized spore protein YtfJ
MALLQSLKESILSQASAKAIYGEPVSAHGKTVIPVAKIMYGKPPHGSFAASGSIENRPTCSRRVPAIVLEYRK